MKLLLVEDDRTIAEGLLYSLRSEGYEAVAAGSVKEAESRLAGEDFSLVLLDLGLPDGDGTEVFDMVKRKGDIPVIFLTARDEEVSVVRGLDMGADDYITKPFRIRELLSRIKSVLRRSGGEAGSEIRLGDITINTASATVKRGDREVLLTALEYRLLLCFANNGGRVLSRSQLLERVWDVSGDFVNDNTLTVYMKRLREKLETDPQNPTVIKTVRGLGYKAGE